MYWLLSLVFILAVIPLLSSCLTLRMSDKALDKYFASKAIKYSIEKYTVAKQPIRFVSVGNENLPTVVFVHGAPGGLDNFKQFLIDSKLIEKARLISVDRPGYGFSGLGKVVTSIEAQSLALKPLIEQIQNGEKVVIVGHSYGGTLVARMAMDYPELISQVIMVAAAIDPENEKMFWFNQPADWPVFRWMLPRPLKVANDEKLSHPEELKKMLPLWENINTPVILIHGQKDNLVPLENAYFGKKKLVNTKLDFQVYEGVNHLIPWNRPDLIKNAVLKCLEKSTDK